MIKRYNHYMNNLYKDKFNLGKFFQINCISATSIFLCCLASALVLSYFRYINTRAPVIFFHRVIRSVTACHHG